MSIVAIYTGKRLAGSSCYLVRTYRSYPRAHCARWGTQLPLSGKGSQQPPTFRPMSIVAKRPPISATAELCANCRGIHTAFFDHDTYRYNQLAGGLHRRGAELPFRRLGFC